MSTENTKQQKKAPWWFTAIFLVAVVFGLVKCYNSCSTKPQAPKLDVSWSQATTEQKQKYLEEVLDKSPDDLMYLQQITTDNIKNYFKYPEEVDFNDRPMFIKSRMQIVEPDSGWYYTQGSGTAKNAFGVKGSFDWSAIIVYTDSTHQIKKLNVTER